MNSKFEKGNRSTIISRRTSHYQKKGVDKYNEMNGIMSNKISYIPKLILIMRRQEAQKGSKLIIFMTTVIARLQLVFSSRNAMRVLDVEVPQLMDCTTR